MHNRCFGIAQISGDTQPIYAIDAGPSSLTSPFNRKAQNTTEGTLLLSGKIMPRMLRQTRVIHVLHLGLLLQPQSQR